MKKMLILSTMVCLSLTSCVPRTAKSTPSPSPTPITTPTDATSNNMPTAITTPTKAPLNVNWIYYELVSARNRFTQAQDSYAYLGIGATGAETKLDSTNPWGKVIANLDDAIRTLEPSQMPGASGGSSALTTAVYPRVVAATDAVQYIGALLINPKYDRNLRIDILNIYERLKIVQETIEESL